MLSESEQTEFETLLRRAELRVPAEELPALERQFLLVKRYRDALDATAAGLDALEPGFRFDAQWGLRP
jgi:hypothetical protein